MSLPRPAPALALLAAGLAAPAVALAVALAQPIGGARIDPASAVAVVVKVPKPWYAPRALVVGRMRDTLPQYAALPGLDFKAYTFARADDRFGGIYLWRNEAAARSFFNAAWFERVEKERGVQGEVRLYEVPVAVDNLNGAAFDGDQAVGTVVTVATPPGVTREQLIGQFQAAIPSYRQVPGLLRKYFIVTDDGRFGGIYLWKDAGSAERWFDAAWHGRVSATYGSPASLEWFDAPILLPGTVAGSRPAIPGL